MTPTQQAVIDAAKKWELARRGMKSAERSLRRLHAADLSDAEYEMADAVRLLKEDERKQPT